MLVTNISAAPCGNCLLEHDLNLSNIFRTRFGMLFVWLVRLLRRAWHLESAFFKQLLKNQAVKPVPHGKPLIYYAYLVRVKAWGNTGSCNSIKKTKTDSIRNEVSRWVDDT